MRFNSLFLLVSCNFASKLLFLNLSNIRSTIQFPLYLEDATSQILTQIITSSFSTYYRVFGLVIGFIAHLHLGIRGNHNAAQITNSH
jgi:hypothetical protein